VAQYTQKFRLGMVRRMIGANRISASALSAESGVAQPTLSRWLREAGTLPDMKHEHEVPQPAAERTPQDKFRLLREAHGLSGEPLGAFLRREALHDSDLEAWRAATLKALSPEPRAVRERPNTSEQKQIAVLEREVRRKDRALAEAAALLVLSKKVQALWGDEGADTEPTRERKR
jgi:hypothetical protein